MDIPRTPLTSGPDHPGTASPSPSCSFSNAPAAPEPSRPAIFPLAAIRSYFTFFDSTIPAEDIPGLAAQLGARAVALADTNTLAGAVVFYKAAQKAGVHPVIGVEITQPLPAEREVLRKRAAHPNARGKIRLPEPESEWEGAALAENGHASPGPAEAGLAGGGPLPGSGRSDGLDGSVRSVGSVGSVGAAAPLGPGSSAPRPSSPRPSSPARASKSQSPQLGHGDRAHRAFLFALDLAGYHAISHLATARMLEPEFDLVPAVAGALRPGHVLVASDCPAVLEGLATAASAGAPPRAVDGGPALFGALLRGRHQRQRNARVLDICSREHLPAMALADVRAASPADLPRHTLLQAMRRLGTIWDVPEADRATAEECLATPAEFHRSLAAGLFALQGDHDDGRAAATAAIEATAAALHRCQLQLPLGQWKFPRFSGLGHDPGALLRELVDRGLRRRYGTPVPEAPRRRADNEIAVVEKLGFAEYFLLVHRIVSEAHSRGFFTVGRGSGANSILSYVLGFTEVCPLRYNLYFERFLNPERSAPPDIDIDFSWRDRDELLQWCFEFFGAERVALIATVQTLQTRQAIREVARAYGIGPAEADRFTALAETGFVVEENGRRRCLAAEEPWRAILRDARALRDFPRHFSIHCGGILITPGDVRDWVPLARAAKGFVITQMDMYSVEDLGLVKIDLLSNRSLGVLKDGLRLAGEAVDQVDGGDRMDKGGDVGGSGRLAGPGLPKSPLQPVPAPPQKPAGPPEPTKPRKPAIKPRSMGATRSKHLSQPSRPIPLSTAPAPAMADGNAPAAPASPAPGGGCAQAPGAAGRGAVFQREATRMKLAGSRRGTSVALAGVLNLFSAGPSAGPHPSNPPGPESHQASEGRPPSGAPAPPASLSTSSTGSTLPTPPPAATLNSPQLLRQRVLDFEFVTADPATRALIDLGRTMGCFYIESPGMRALFERLRCQNFEEVVAASSIIRPGVAESGMMAEYIERHQARARQASSAERLATGLLPVNAHSKPRIVREYLGLLPVGEGSGTGRTSKTSRISRTGDGRGTGTGHPNEPDISGQSHSSHQSHSSYPFSPSFPSHPPAPPSVAARHQSAQPSRRPPAKNGRRSSAPVHPRMVEILPETYGVMVYQEDVLRVAHEIAGLSYAQADTLRRAMSGKARSREAMLALESQFIAGAVGRGLPEPDAREVWRQMASFAGYSFCKGHSAAFAVLSYQVSYLKAHFPAEFIAALISNQGGFYGPGAYLEEARRWGVEVLAPCVNHSDAECSGRTLVPDPWPVIEPFLRPPAAPEPLTDPRVPPKRPVIGWLRIGLHLVSGLRKNTPARIPAERQLNGPFSSLENFLLRTAILAEEAHRLADAGALDGLLDPRHRTHPGALRPTLHFEIERHFRARATQPPADDLFASAPGAAGHSIGRIGQISPMSSGAVVAAGPSRAPGNAPPWTVLETCQREVDALGFMANAHPLDFILEIPTLATRRGSQPPPPLVPARLIRQFSGQPVRMVGWLITAKILATKTTGQPMKMLTLEDRTDTFEATLFPRIYARFAPRTLTRGPYLVEGTVDTSLGSPVLTVSHIQTLALEEPPIQVD